MVPSTIRVLFHPRPRVYNLRLLLLADVVMIVMLALVVPTAPVWDGETAVVLGLVCGIVTCLHHILVAFSLPIRGLALIDLVMVFLELLILIKFPAPGDTHIPAIVVIVALLVSGIFRISTMVKTKELFYRQRLAFLGCCPQEDPRYTPLSILLNRSIARPLVRGESKVIIIARAFIISCVAIGVPAFGLYSIVILPPNADVYTKSIVYSSVTGSAPLPALTGNASIYLETFDLTIISPDQINATGAGQNSPAEFICSSTYGTSTSGIQVQCPIGWSEMDLISISVAFPPGVKGLYATVVPRHSGELEDFFGNLQYNMHPIALLPGSHLLGLLTWSARLLSPRDSSHWVFIPEITSLQPNPAANREANSPHIAQLTLYQVSTYPVQYFRDMSDSSALSGVSSLGGFWTFVNGAFVLLFGANVIYFAFGRRPLSALGVVHLFQRRSLSRQWHEDFPALHTEGGLPGSESAGIVAFIRERLVDVGDGPRTSDTRDAAEPGETETLHHQLNSDCEESPVLHTQHEENWQRKEYSSDNGGTE